MLVAGARPNFIKVAPLIHALLRSETDFSTFLVHTGQHYDEAMSRVFFDELRIPRPDVDMGIGSGSHAKQTAAIMVGFEAILLEQRPHALIVVGDVNSTVASSLVAVKLGIPVYHIEAGLRSFDRAMPEEINRIVTDSISDLLFVSEEAGLDNLRREGVAEEKIHFVGNVMIDTLIAQRENAARSTVLDRLGLESQEYALLTLHRPSNVDAVERFRDILEALKIIAASVPIIFPVHPRTLEQLARHKLQGELASIGGLRLVSPLSYIDFLRLETDARLVLTDSGGVQEETTFLRVPCLTLRENTERPVTALEGTNSVVGTCVDSIVSRTEKVLNGGVELPDAPPPLWDGHAAERIVATIARELKPHEAYRGKISLC